VSARPCSRCRRGSARISSWRPGRDRGASCHSLIRCGARVLASTWWKLLLPFFLPLACVRIARLPRSVAIEPFAACRIDALEHFDQSRFVAIRKAARVKIS
jgi:hypothetical protein